MAWLQESFGWAWDLYSRWFANWLHINFVIRTILLLLMLWLIIYVSSILFKYVLGPLVVWFYVNILKRAWNYLVIETLQEWIYIRYYSKDDPQYANLYLRLCDKVKHNRAALAQSKQTGIPHSDRIKKLGNRMMISALIIVTMWVVAFGLNQEYALPALAVVDGNTNEAGMPVENDQEPDDPGSSEPDNNEDPPSISDIYTPGLVRPGQFPAGAQVVLALTEEAARDGARLRNGPGITGTTVIEMLWGYDLLTYLDYYVHDPDVEALYWLRVRTPLGTEGYIGSQLVEVVG